MAEGRLPLIRGRISEEHPYTSPIGGGPPDLPSLDPRAHGRRLLDQIDAVGAAVASRPEGARDEEASREIIAVRPGPDLSLAKDSLGNQAADAQVVGVMADTGVVLLDVADPSLAHLRKKVDAFLDDMKAKIRPSDGLLHRAHEAALLPVGAIGLATLADRSGPRLRAARLDDHTAAWFEVSCRGGHRHDPAVSTSSRDKVGRQLIRLGAAQAFDEFMAPELVVLFLRMTPAQARQLVEVATDCIYEVELAAPPLRDMKLAGEASTTSLRGVGVDLPHPDAPSIVLLDSGVATSHPLLRPVLLSATTAGDAFDSPEDRYGHGTRMAGVAIFPDLGSAVFGGNAAAAAWLQSSRLIDRPGQGTADDANAAMWPVLTAAAVRSVEEEDKPGRRRVFALAVTRSTQDEPLGEPRPTQWSHALDQLAYGNGAGRLFVVSAGNARDEQQLALAQQYPYLQLSERIHQPAQASNVVTVGAYTERVSLPPGRLYAEAQPIAPSGGIAPSTTCGASRSGLPNKPDIVMEGGNITATGAFLDESVPTLCTLTTSKEHDRNKPLGFLSKTSEATARASRLAAEIWAIEPSLRPETVRALLVHSASWTPTMEDQFPVLTDRLLACGLGVPDPAMARECARDRATIVVEDAMPNAVLDEVLRDPPPKRASTPPTKPVARRRVKFFRLPTPEGVGTDDPPVELRVTLSYFAEPSTFGSRVYRGMSLKWDMQGPQEDADQFHERINKMMREEDEDGRRTRTSQSRGFSWELGMQLRSRGTVQSDRWRGPLSSLAGDKLIAVVPVLGWWNRHKALELAEMRFSLVVSVTAPGVYAAIRPVVAATVEV